MQYSGKLYGKVGGKYFPMLNDTNHYNKLEQENKRLREALESISKNTCCDNCQEAAKWAKEALKDE